MTRPATSSDKQTGYSFARPVWQWSRQLLERSLTRGFALGVAFVVFAVLVLAAEMLFARRTADLRADLSADTQAFAAELRARCDRELNAVLYLSSGIAGYLVVRHDRLDRAETDEILAAVFRDGHHVRNIAIAEGFRLTHVYPLAGNQAALGRDYRAMKEQWPAIKRAIDTRQPVLTGPVRLVQGGSGLIYRNPIFVNDNYWGMLSTVVDITSLVGAVTRDLDDHGFDYAVRTEEPGVAPEGVLFGNLDVLDDHDAVRLDAEIGNLRWLYAARPKPREVTPLLWAAHATAWLLAAAAAFGAFTIMRQRYQLALQAGYDSLTGLPNRRLFDDRLEQALYRRDRGEAQQLALMFVDLNEFKPINDRFGHRVGDDVLRLTASRLRDEIRIGDTVARLSGDEFVIIVDGTTRDQALQLVARLQQRIGEPMRVRDHAITTSAAIGVAFYPGEAHNAATLLSLADERMYADKRGHQR